MDELARPYIRLFIEGYFFTYMLPTSTKALRKEIGLRLKQAREKAGYVSPEDFCERNNLSLALYLAWEAGETNVKMSHILRYSKKLRVSVSWLMLGALAEKSHQKIKNPHTQ
jgi:transcriptional regulator with XRE-family HTH domain